MSLIFENKYLNNFDVSIWLIVLDSNLAVRFFLNILSIVAIVHLNGGLNN